MDEYITKGKLIENVLSISSDMSGNWTTNEVIEMIKRTSPESVKPTREGEWKIKRHEPDMPKWAIRIKCSECGLVTGQVSNFCPQCGAKMH